MMMISPFQASSFPHCLTSTPFHTCVTTQNVVSEQPERFFVAELIREKVFLLYAQEIPYSVQVRGGGRERGGNKGGKGAAFKLGFRYQIRVAV